MTLCRVMEEFITCFTGKSKIVAPHGNNGLENDV